MADKAIELLADKFTGDQDTLSENVALLLRRGPEWRCADVR